MNNIVKAWIYVLIGLIVISIILSFFLNLIPAFRIVFGSFYVLFLPGYFLTYLFFPKTFNKNKNIDIIERIALSFAFSIAIVPLIVFYLNLIGIKINTWNSFFTILAIIIITLIGIKIRKKYSKT